MHAKQNQESFVLKFTLKLFTFAGKTEKMKHSYKMKSIRRRRKTQKKG